MIGLLASALGVLASAVWLIHAINLIRHPTPRLADRPEAEPPGGWPSLSMIFAARDEAAGVGPAVRSMLSQDYPNLSVVAVDDRSTDATGAILLQCAAEDDRLQVVRVEDLPTGWLGKNHALHEAAGTSRADWYLFTDADVVFAPGSLRKALAEAVAGGADHMVATPDIATGTAGERLFLTCFVPLFGIHSPPWRVVDPDQPTFFGVGAFNLVRAEPFRAVGGFQRISMSVDDDMRLGQALKVAGYRARVVSGAGLISVRWQVGFGGMIRGLEKNFFAGLNFRIGRALAALAGIAVLGIAPYVGLGVGPWWARLVCAGAVTAIAWILTRAGGQGGVDWRWTPALPLASIAVGCALARSTWMTLRRGGIRWRDRTYPLTQLRAHAEARSAWTRDVWRSTR